MKTKEEKFKLIIHENRERIARICSYYAPTTDDRQDIEQEVLINIWKSLDSFRGDSAVSTWIYRIAINTSLGFAGKEFKRTKFRVNLDLNQYQSFMQQEESADKDVELNLERLNVVMNQLSVIDKAILSLDLEGESSREIADIIGITEPNVRVKIHRIKQFIKEKMKGDGYE